MSKYMTKQREVLLGFLSEHPDESFSARQIAERLKDDKISVSAVYRNLSALEEDGKLRRVMQGTGREVFYQYADCDACKECLHLSCKKCGKTYHMSTQGADMLMNNVASQEKFFIDKVETVLYGICEKCKATQK